MKRAFGIDIPQCAGPVIACNSSVSDCDSPTTVLDIS
jgi:hypothetical protein